MRCAFALLKRLGSCRTFCVRDSVFMLSIHIARSVCVRLRACVCVYACACACVFTCQYTLCFHSSVLAVALLFDFAFCNGLNGRSRTIPPEKKEEAKMLQSQVETCAQEIKRARMKSRNHTASFTKKRETEAEHATPPSL